VKRKECMVERVFFLANLGTCSVFLVCINLRMGSCCVLVKLAPRLVGFNGCGCGVVVVSSIASPCCPFLNLD
jgi:hypothetical protein